MFALALSAAALFAANVATPGASFILTLRHSLTFGAPAGRRLALGLTAADIVYVIAALSGVAALLRMHAGVAASVGAFGGVWLGALGLALLQASRNPTQVGEAAPEAEVLPSGRAFRVGLVAGLINPQSILFLSTVILASLPGEPSVGQGIVLALAVAATSLAMRRLIATVSAHRFVRERYLARRRILEAISGAALLFFGMRLAVKSLTPWAIKAAFVTGLVAHAF